jgi:hypothetical protein
VQPLQMGGSELGAKEPTPSSPSPSPCQQQQQQGETAAVPADSVVTLPVGWVR